MKDLRGSKVIVPSYRPRFCSEEQIQRLVNLFHLARTALSGPGGRTRHERMVWAAAEFSKENPEISSSAAYKDLCNTLDSHSR